MSKRLYQELRLQYTEEEIAESFVLLPSSLSEEERTKTNKDLSTARKERKMSWRTKFLLKCAQIKFKLEDNLNKK